MPEDSRQRAARRLAIARGHLESIRRSLEDPDVYCVDVLRQIKAVQGALDGAASVVLRGHLEAHVATAATSKRTWRPPPPGATPRTWWTSSWTCSSTSE